MLCYNDALASGIITRCCSSKCAVSVSAKGITDMYMCVCSVRPGDKSSEFYGLILSKKNIDDKSRLIANFHQLFFAQDYFLTVFSKVFRCSSSFKFLDTFICRLK
jgi:hypothetical protein